MEKKYEEHGYNSRQIYDSDRPVNYDNEDVFGHEEGHDVPLHLLRNFHERC